MNFGILPLTFADPVDADGIQQADILHLAGLHNLRPGEKLTVQNVSQNVTFFTRQKLSSRQIDVLRAGGLIDWVKASLHSQPFEVEKS